MKNGRHITFWGLFCLTKSMTNWCLFLWSDGRNMIVAYWEDFFQRFFHVWPRLVVAAPAGGAILPQPTRWCDIWRLCLFVCTISPKERILITSPGCIDDGTRRSWLHCGDAPDFHLDLGMFGRILFSVRCGHFHHIIRVRRPSDFNNLLCHVAFG